jgi:hypothetical protein
VLLSCCQANQQYRSTSKVIHLLLLLLLLLLLWLCLMRAALLGARHQRKWLQQLTACL